MQRNAIRIILQFIQPYSYKMEKVPSDSIPKDTTKGAHQIRFCCFLPDLTSRFLALTCLAMPEHPWFSLKPFLLDVPWKELGITFWETMLAGSLDFTLVEALKSPWFLLPTLRFVSDNSNSNFSGLVFSSWKTFFASSLIARACKMIREQKHMVKRN